MARMTIDGYHVQGAPAGRTVTIQPEVHTINGPGTTRWTERWAYIVLPLGTLLLAWLILGQAGCGVHRNLGFVQAAPAAQVPIQRHTHPLVNITVQVPPQASAPISSSGPSWLSCPEALKRQGIDPTSKCR